MDMNHVFDAIARERAYQDDKYGPAHDRRLSIADYLVILRGELEEAEQGLRKQGTPDALLEVMQVAAVAVACLEYHGVIERDGQQQRTINTTIPLSTMRYAVYSNHLLDVDERIELLRWLDTMENMQA